MFFSWQLLHWQHSEWRILKRSNSFELFIYDEIPPIVGMTNWKRLSFWTKRSEVKNLLIYTIYLYRRSKLREIPPIIGMTNWKQLSFWTKRSEVKNLKKLTLFKSFRRWWDSSYRRNDKMKTAVILNETQWSEESQKAVTLLSFSSMMRFLLSSEWQDENGCHSERNAVKWRISKS